MFLIFLFRALSLLYWWNKMKEDWLLQNSGLQFLYLISFFFNVIEEMALFHLILPWNCIASTTCGMLLDRSSTYILNFGGKLLMAFFLTNFESYSFSDIEMTPGEATHVLSLFHESGITFWPILLSAIREKNSSRFFLIINTKEHFDVTFMNEMLLCEKASLSENVAVIWENQHCCSTITQLQLLFKVCATVGCLGFK